jgi:putative ABC transport system permease protein
MALRTYRGSSVIATPVHGRIPERAGEIMLGSATASAVDAHVGSTITARLVNGAPEHLRVVGVGAFPTLSDSLGLGKGAATTISTLLTTLPPGATPPPPDTMLVRFAPTADRARAIADLAHHLDASFAVVPAEKPVDLVNFGRVQNLPSILAGLLAMLAALTLAHLLITSVRRRRRDFAMLRALGFTSGQLSGTVAVLATTLVALALVVGIPAGLILAHVLWQLFAHNLGVVARPAMPVGAIAAVVPIAIVAANLVGYAAARRARRIDPAAALRTE